MTPALKHGLTLKMASSMTKKWVVNDKILYCTIAIFSYKSIGGKSLRKWKLFIVFLEETRFALFQYWSPLSHWPCCCLVLCDLRPLTSTKGAQNSLNICIGDVTYHFVRWCFLKKIPIITWDPCSPRGRHGATFCKML